MPVVVPAMVGRNVSLEMAGISITASLTGGGGDSGLGCEHAKHRRDKNSRGIAKASRDADLGRSRL